MNQDFCSNLIWNHYSIANQQLLYYLEMLKREVFQLVKSVIELLSIIKIERRLFCSVSFFLSWNCFVIHGSSHSTWSNLKVPKDRKRESAHHSDGIWHACDCIKKEYSMSLHREMEHYEETYNNRWYQIVRGYI